MKDFSAPQWQEILRHNQLDGFEALWELQADWFETPNQRRGGWSGVVRIELNLPDGGTEAVFVKRQENHTRRTLRHPLRGEPTFAGEMENILALQQAGVPTLEPVYYRERKASKGWQAILVTRELGGFRSLAVLMREWLDMGWSQSVVERRRLIGVLASAIRRMHNYRLAHNSLHPKHVFVRLVEGGDPEVCLIDLEKMRHTIAFSLAARRDLDSLNRRTRVWSSADRLRFLKSYLNLHALNGAGKNLWRYLARRKIKFMHKKYENVD
ncbi:MAG: lipopolysaccharide kinase [Gammaproteobacteria bacterium]|nr:lipopolysaccharide kinase [Gammaproteobacteria bacterium]